MTIRVRVCPERNGRAAEVVGGLLEREPDLELMYCRAEGCGAPEAQTECAADVVVIPVGFPDMRDLTHLQGALAQHSGAPLIVLGLCEDHAFIQHLREAGASAFLALDEAVRELPPMIRRLVAERAAVAHAV
jgi:DNA-binding NarL/FixJ family response regulator